MLENEGPSMISATELEFLIQSVMELGKNQESSPAVPANRLQTRYEEIEAQMERLFIWVRCSGRVPVEQLQELALKKIYPLLDNPESLSILHKPVRPEGYLYWHSLDVAVLAGFLGRWLKLSEAEVQNLVFAGLVHDIGKTRLQYELLVKPDKLTPEEFKSVKFHAELGFKLMQQCPDIPESVLEAVLQHHERPDGTGYPNGFRTEKIHLFAKILSVADVYDALTSDRYYKKAVSPLEASQVMAADEHQFDQPVLGCFFTRLRRQLPPFFLPAADVPVL